MQSDVEETADLFKFTEETLEERLCVQRKIQLAETSPLFQKGHENRQKRIQSLT